MMKKNYFLLIIAVLIQACNSVNKNSKVELENVSTINHNGIIISQENIVGQASAKIFSAEIPQKKFNLELVKPYDAIDSSYRVSQWAKEKSALIAINAGFFSIYEKAKGIQLPSYNLNTCYPNNYDPYNALPARNLKINAKWFGTFPNENGVVAWSKKQELFYIDKIKNINYIKLLGNDILFNNFNRYPLNSNITVFTDIWKKPIPIYKSGMLLYSDKSKIIKIEKLSSKGKGFIVPKDGFVVFLSDAVKLPPLKIGDALTLEVKTISSSNLENKLEKIDFIVSGNPILIQDGKIQENYPNTHFYLNSYARTAICQLTNNNILLLVVSGNDESLGKSVGLSIPELSTVMLQKGCYNAINLDGGHSSVFYFNGKVLNRNFSSKEDDCFKIHERSVSDLILVK
ncbi:phosphodiester glycosidase family protein [Pigmentibacter sp. JX0631]|uniref:phosphodiester glycosidase family protein n=1 Tax=Pigmentibacter sp. JX0631 TaxID=2976982 RepID=UPI00246849B8|nr:phosphodiester glycosidase family protein [Pigmentibacter sp. JX0631]WGL58950.1 phosphodiester glycosidase family protein [Pigmentibacter sp. JX0631]